MNAQQLKNAILQEAIEGRLVPQDPNDEPASALLARIRKEKEQLVKEKKIVLSKPEKAIKESGEVPFILPANWTWALVNDVCRVFGRIGFRGYTTNDLRDSKEGAAISLSPSNMINGVLDFSSCTYISDEKYEESPEIQIKNGDILIVKTGSSYGKTSIVKNLPWKSTINPQIAVVKDVKIDVEYLKFYFQSSYAQSCFKNFVLGTSIPTFSQLNLISMKIPLPPLAEQHRIVAKIEELLPKVEEYGKAQDALNKLNEELPERLKKSILQEAIEGRLVPQAPNDEPASVLLAQIRKEKEQLVKAGKLKKKDLNETHISEDEIPFEIPDSWMWVRLGDVTEIARGGSPRPIKEYLTDAPNGLNWIKIGDTDKGGKYINSCKEKIKPEGLKKTRMVHPGDFLLTNSMSFGRPYITNIEGCIHDGWLMISPYAGVFDQSFLFYVLSSAFAHKQFSDKVAGAVVQNLNSDKVADSYVPIPPLAEQHRIVEKLEQLLGEIDKLKK